MAGTNSAFMVLISVVYAKQPWRNIFANQLLTPLTWESVCPNRCGIS